MEDFNYQEFPDCRELLIDLIQKGDQVLLNLIKKHNELYKCINSNYFNELEKKDLVNEKVKIRNNILEYMKIKCA